MGYHDNLLLREEVEIQNRVSAYYDNMRYANKHSFKYHKWLTEKMVSLIRRNGKILDNGCGTGILSLLFPHRRVVGLDISLGMLAKARLNNNKLVCANSEVLPFINRSFDAVFCRSILHHLANPRQAVDEMYRVLNSRGELILVETNRSFFNDLPRRLIKNTEHFSKLHRNFDRRELLNILGGRFIIKDVYHFGFFAYPLIGFPDILNMFQYLPFKAILAKILIILDEYISKIPILRTQSWGIIIKSVKK